MKMKTLILPKKYLSYSAITLWNSDKDKFRKRYYEGIKFPENIFQVFGKRIEEEIYAGKYPEIPFFGNPQHELKTEIEGIPIIGYLDSFYGEKKQFLDYKTSISSSSWDSVSVQKLEQLPFYSMLVKRIYKKVDKKCFLVWLETKFKKDEGLLQNKNEIIFTGKFLVFERIIEKWERDRMIEYVIKAANEISNDFRKWKRSHQAGVKGALLK